MISIFRGKMKHWTLENVEESAKKNPGQFFIPSMAERKAQVIGDIVRLHFLLTEKKPEFPRAERMWVEISNVIDNGENFTGHLINQPQYIAGLNVGDLITFHINNIAQVVIKETSPKWVECGELSALVSKRCFDKGEFVRFIYREKPDRADDSGWRLFTGHESEEETNDPKNIRICNIYWLLDWDSTLFDIVKNGKSGDVFERQEKILNWEKVEDWTPGE